MSSNEAPSCQHIKTNGTRCASPALRNEKFCYFHQRCRPVALDFRGDYRDYSGYEFFLPNFEDATSIQITIRQLAEIIMRNKIDRKEAGLLLYALQIASFNLKRMSLEIPKPGEIVVDPEAFAQAQTEAASLKKGANEGNRKRAPHPDDDPPGTPYTTAPKTPERKEKVAKGNPGDTTGNLPPGTIQACQRVRKKENNQSRNEQRLSEKRLSEKRLTQRGREQRLGRYVN
jgi:hypothetical protein